MSGPVKERSNRPCVHSLDVKGAISRDFFARSALDVARDLIGMNLVRRSAEGTVSGTIVETEAYCGVEDPAAHTFRGRRTARNEVMWGPPAHAYIYPIYGKYHCLNVVCGPPGTPEAVLLRAVRPSKGVGIMASRRGMPAKDEADRRKLCSGPSKLCIAFGLTRENNGMDMVQSDLHFTTGDGKVKVVTSKRIGVEYAQEAALWPWRFLLHGDP
jgi:DNA-3-methyladenine glycosylase